MRANTMNTTYVPVDCTFHDLLESLATTGKPSRILFVTEAGVAESRTASIIDLFARQGEEYLVLDTGDTVRLDRLVEVDGVSMPAHASCEVPADVTDP